MTSYLRFAAGALLVAITVACGGSNADQRTDTTGTTQLKVALLTPGPISDKAWNSGAYDGLVALKDSLGADISHIQTKTPAEFEENFRQYGSKGFNIVIGHGFEFQDAAARVAPSYPNTVFVITSGRVTAPNIAGVSYAFEEASYQAGIIAGGATKTNVIGMIGGTELPPVTASFIAFERGAQLINPNVKVLTSFVGNWDDPSAGREQALAQISRNVDVIFQNADAAGLGIFQAAREKKIFAFGANANQNDIAPEVILGSVYIDHTKVFMQIAREVQQQTFVGRVFNFGVKENVVRLILNDALRDRIAPRALIVSDSVGQSLTQGTFHALDDILQGADTAQPLRPKR